MDDTKIFRYKFADEVVEEIHRFAQIHRTDDRHQFKDAWTKWKDDNAQLVQCEVERLTSLNYRGDVLDKMFKSARYYFRKKGTEKKEPVSRRVYVSVSKDILLSVDRHIQNSMRREGFTPAKGYDDFCGTNEDILSEWIVALRREEFDVKEIQDKIKKTYKNRYYVVRKTNLGNNSENEP